MQTENSFRQTWDKPGWQVYLLLPVLHYVAIQISFYCGKTPENEVIIWLPNAVLLTALLLFRGQGGWLMAAITFASNVIGNLPTAPLGEAILLSIVNLIEIGLTYLLLRHARFSSRFTQVQDFAKFVIAGPLVSAFISGLLGAAVIVAYGTPTAYFTLMRVWWFDDGLGLLIFAPLLMLASMPADEPISWRLADLVVLSLSIGLLGTMFIPRHGTIADLPLTPTLLIPSMLFLALRFGIFGAALSVAAVSLTISRLAAIDNQPFGAVNLHETVIHTQEFILTFSIICMGAAILRSQLKAHERDLEQTVRERTHALSTSLQQLKHAQKDLVQSEKLASLGVLVAGVSHELNTPIGNAVTGVSVLQHRMEETRKNLTAGKLGRSELTHFFEEGLEIIALLDRSCQRASNLVVSFKQVAVDRASERRRDFNLLKLVDDNANIWKVTHKNAQFAIVMEISPQISCNSYPGPLGQIVSNLIQNAELHAFEGQGDDTHRGTLRIVGAATESEITLDFVDDGKGMDAETLARIFDPFFTTRLGQGGSGLGLSICRNIAVAVLGGGLNAASDHGKGAHFTLTFPRRAPS